jgi:hypothetical protein
MAGGGITAAAATGWETDFLTIGWGDTGSDLRGVDIDELETLGEGEAAGAGFAGAGAGAGGDTLAITLPAGLSWGV